MGCYLGTIGRLSCGAVAVGRSVARLASLICAVFRLARMHCDPYPVCSAHPRGTSHRCLGNGTVCCDHLARIRFDEADNVLSEADGGVCNFCCLCGSDVAPSCPLALSYEVLDDSLRREVFFLHVAVVRCWVMLGEVVGVIKLP